MRAWTAVVAPETDSVSHPVARRGWEVDGVSEFGLLAAWPS